MARRNFDWHVGWWSETLLQVAGNQQAVLTLVTDAELAGYEDDVIVERVIGQYSVYNQSDTSSLGLHIRMAVRPENEAAVFTLDTSLAQNADEAFMWHKVLRVQPQQYSDVQYPHPEFSHIDCRVNRKLEALDRLVLTFDPWAPIPSPEFYYVGAWIRVLLKT